MLHHGRALVRLTRDEAALAALFRDPGTAPLGARSRALVDLALQLTRQPHASAEDGVRALRAAGLDDRGIHDAVAIVSYFNFVNRMALGLGVQLEPEYRDAP